MDIINFSTKKGNCKMLQILIGFLLFTCLCGGFGFFAGYMAGRAIERVEVHELLERYYNNESIH